MDSTFREFLDSIGVSRLDDENILRGFDRSPNVSDTYMFSQDSPDLSFLNIPSLPPDLVHDAEPTNFGTSSNLNSEMTSGDDNEFSDSVLKYLNEILTEENVEEDSSVVHDPLALQAAENSFYQILDNKYTPSTNQSTVHIDQNVQSPDGNSCGISSESQTNSSSHASNFTDPHCVSDSVEFTPSSSLIETQPAECFSQTTLQSGSQLHLSSSNSFSNGFLCPVDTASISHLVSNIFTDSHSIFQFKRGMEEASKFLPMGNPLLIGLEKYAPPLVSKQVPSSVVVNLDKDERDNGFLGRKNHDREDSDIKEERSSKQSTCCVEEAELSEMFDRVLLNDEIKVEPPPCCAGDEEMHTQNCRSSGSNSGKTRGKKRCNKEEKLDLRTLLISCAQSVAADDRRSADEQLKKIRQHTSPFGDGSQRLAHIFANALEARLAGTGSQIYKALASKQISAADMLKVHQLYISASPFKKIAIFYANSKILEVAEKAKKLHIIDFGILFGFQWPIFIQRLSTRPGGPPKLRITGIDFPQPGFRPAERVEQTGQRLAKYCERFNVQFEYNAIAQNWQTIQIEDLKIENDEMLVVNSLFRFRNLLDDTVAANGPRDAVLRFIRKINPTIFLHAVVSGSHGAPFFLTRFKEAIFHYSALFDMFDSNIPREDQERLMFEREYFGREIMSAVACEGSERLERPETYKHWQVRNTSAGFKILPLNQNIVRRLKAKVRADCPKDFVIEEDNNWMLQGWKGRIIYASSCWVPS